MTAPAADPAPLAAAAHAIARGTPEYRRFALAILVAGYAAFTLLYAVQPLLPVFTAEFGIGPAEASLAIAIATGPMALALLPASILSDRIGRRPVMSAALFLAASVTVLTPFLPGWHAFLAMRMAVGVALAGVTATAMAYIAEELACGAVGAAMGLYIAGAAMGGMLGRFGMGLLSEWFGWRWAMEALGLSSLAGAILFRWAAPASQGFVARAHSAASLRAALGRLFADAALPWLYLAGFLLMGLFVTIYNYAGFRLAAPPFALTPGAVGAIFLLYLLGSASSAAAGELAGRLGQRRLFWMPAALLVGGIALTVPARLGTMVAGIALITVAFFAAHSIASSWVGRRGGGDRGLAASLYVASYYMGSSLVSWLGGKVWARWAWPGVAGYAGLLALAALAIALRLACVPPLPGPRLRDDTPPLPAID